MGLGAHLLTLLFQVKIGALEVLAERIPLVSETVRRECKPTAIQIVQLTHDIIARRSAGKLAEAGLAGFKAIASTCQVGEEAALTSTIPDVLKIVKSRTSAASALAVLPCYMCVTILSKLGSPLPDNKPMAARRSAHVSSLSSKRLYKNAR